MHPHFAPLLTFLCLFLVTTQAAGDPPRTDRYGDPLPPGVVARLGTERLTLTDTWSELTFSPDGRHLATYDYGDQLRIWDVNSGKELLHIKERPIRWHGRLVYSPDGKTLAMGYGDQAAGAGKVRVWEAATGKELHDLGGRLGQKMPNSLRFSPDGRSLFAGGHDRPILCWDLAGGGTPRRIGDSSSAPFVVLSRDGKTLTAGYTEASDGRKWTFARWDIASGKEIGRHMLTTAPYWSGSLSPDGSIFARPEEDGKSITLFDPATGREIARARGSDYPASIDFSADGSLTTCCSKDGIVHIWDTATGKVRARFKALSTGIIRIALSPDGKRLALTGGADRAIHVWDVAAGRELHSFVGHRGRPLAIAFLKDSKEIATVSRDSGVSRPIVTWADWSLRRWDAATGAELAIIRANPNGAVCCTAFSADGRLLARVIHDGTLNLLDVESGKELRSWKVPTLESTTNWMEGKVVKKVFKTPYPAITEPAFSPDGKMLLAAEVSMAGRGGKKIHRWEVATGRELPAFEIEGIEQQEFSWCLPSPDGRTLVVWNTGSRHNSVRLVDAANGEVRRQLEDTRFGQNPPAFSPDGRTLACGNFGEVSLWEVATGQSRGRLKGPRWASCLAFSPDGRFLAVGSNLESPVTLWDLVTGQVAGQLRNDFGRVESIVFAPDGTRLAVAGDSPTVLVCDVAELCGKKKVEEIAKSDTRSMEELDRLWIELSGADGARAYRAILQLGLAGPQGAVFVKARLKDDKPPDERRIAQLIGDLDDDKFATREKASKELEKLGVRAEPMLRRALEGKASAEVRLRIKHLLEPLDALRGSSPSPGLVRLRATEALEANGSKEALQALTELSEGSTDAQLAQEAKASLARLRSGRIQP